MKRHGTRGRLRTPLGAIVLLCAGFAIAIGDETANLVVTNRTPKVLTIVIADRTYEAVAAGKAVSYASKDSATVGVRASYAPGQGVTGSAQRSFHLARVSTGQGSYTYFACAVNAGITSPVMGGPIHWHVTADTLTVPED